jgi:hypothetical protein
MKLVYLIILALALNVLSFFILRYSEIVPSQDTAFWDAVNSWIWVIGLLAAVIYSVAFRKILFKLETIFWTILTLVFCTPVPLIAFFIMW